jgi:hypothetical protein
MTRGPRWGGLLIVFLVGLGAAGWWLWDLYRASNRTDLSSFWQLVVAVAALGVTLVPLVKDWLATREVGDDGGVALDRLADRLADAVYRQWTQAAAERGLLQPDPIEVRWSQPSSVAGSAEAATVSRRFLPIPGLAATRQEQLRQGGLRDLHAIYGGLGSGRLVIVGSPGSGKSGAAVLLVLAAVEHRRAVEGTTRAKVPVPVLFTFAGWDPSTPLRDWLVSQLRRPMRGFSSAGAAPGRPRNSLTRTRSRSSSTGSTRYPSSCGPTPSRPSVSRLGFGWSSCPAMMRWLSPSRRRGCWARSRSG